MPASSPPHLPPHVAADHDAPSIASPTAAAPLDSATRSDLRAQAHHLKPVVMISDAGLSEAVVAETDRALNSHNLIKVRVFSDDREQRESLMTELCARLGCSPVQAIGKLLVLWRAPNAEQVAKAASKRRKPRKPVVKKKAEARSEARRANGGANAGASRGKPTPASVASRKAPARPSPARPASSTAMQSKGAPMPAGARAADAPRRDASKNPLKTPAVAGKASGPALKATRAPAARTTSSSAESPPGARPTGLRLSPARPGAAKSASAFSAPAARAANKAYKAGLGDSTRPTTRPAAKSAGAKPIGRPIGKSVAPQAGATGAAPRPSRPASSGSAARPASGTAARPASGGAARPAGGGLKSLSRLAPAGGSARGPRGDKK